MVRREICIDSVPGEMRVALVEDGLLTELLIDRPEARGVAGNVYLGRVRNILPGMQAAFVDLGLERDGFLFVEDASGSYRPPDEDPEVAAVPPAPVPAARIEDCLREGQEVVVQVAKDPMGRKGARITTHITLPGHFLVFLPGVDHIGVSRRIEDAAERERLRLLLSATRERLAAPGGYIVRTVGCGLGEESFAPDAAALLQEWQGLLKRRTSASAPALLRQEAGAVTRALRDLFADDVEEVTADSEPILEEAAEFLRRAHPALLHRIRRHEGDAPLFESRGLTVQLERALRPRVWLKSGGSIVINQTEALVAVDVNTGKYVGRADLEETIVKTNLEAVREIVRQIRLRDLGGIVVIDLIDMDEADSRARVIEALEEELRKDRARSRMLQISDFGLVEITRQRTRPSLERLLCRPCPSCGGAGQAKSAETLGFDIIRELRRTRHTLPGGLRVVRAHADVVSALEGRASELLSAAGLPALDRLQFRIDPALRPDQWSLEAG